MIRIPMLVLLVLSACGTDQEAQKRDAEKRASAAASELVATLGARLKTAMSESGPANAIEVCSKVAYDLTAKIGEKHGVRIKRTSLRVRNPKNAPDDAERERLETWTKNLQETGLEDVVTWRKREDGRDELYFYRALLLQDLCAKCHGDPSIIPDDVKKILANTYPDDSATGFKPGDLRGVISIRVALQR